MKRTFTTIVCALLLVAMLAGCGSTGSNPFDAKAKTFSDDGWQITLTTAFSEEDLEATPLATLRTRRSCSPSMRQRRVCRRRARKT